MIKKPEVCILPVAGLSTRNLPSTKAIHKGFLTLHSKPIIQYAVDACAEIGIKEIVFIYSDQSCKYLFEKHFSPYPWLENHLREKGKLELLKVLEDIIPRGMKFSFAEQKEPHGNGHAILMAKDIVGERRETMTGQQLEQIAALRRKNYPYSFIGRELGLSPNTVKSVCRRKGFGATGLRKTKAEKLNAPICRYCHKIIDGRKGQNFCSEFCRIEWWKARRKVIAK